MNTCECCSCRLEDDLIHRSYADCLLHIKQDMRKLTERLDKTRLFRINAECAEPTPPTLDEMALNEAAWELSDCGELLGGEIKSFLRRAITTYLEKAGKS